MKRPGLTTSQVSATLFLILSVAAPLGAQETMSPAAAAKAAKRADDLLKRYDKNADGKLDDDERADAKEMMLKEQVDRQMARAAALPGGLEQFRTQALQLFDRNRDGQLDEGERNDAQQFLTKYRDALATVEALNKRFDQNGDGAIDATERTTIDSFLTALRGFGSHQMRSELLRRFDQNTNGKIEDGELAQLEDFVRPRVEASAVQLRRYDTDHDGKLSDAEWTVARAAIVQWLNASGPVALELESMPAKTPREVEQARLDAVAAEVARRRAIREGAKKMIEPPK